jgi:predicted DNA binding CopG/RHH family protein
VKTTLEIPDAIFRRAKAKAAQRGVPLRQFVSEAVAEKLGTQSLAREKARMKLAGRLRHLRKETARINVRIEQEFERIEPEACLAAQKEPA